MNRSWKAACVLAAAGALGVVGVHSASGADDSTPVQAQVDGGALSISAPASFDLGSVSPGGTASATLAGVAVTDDRAGVLGWVTSVSMGDLTPETQGGISIPASGFTYDPAAATTTGTVTVTETTATGAGPSVVQTATAVTGQNAASWDAVVSFVIPSDALADSYAAVLTHSVI